MYQKLRPSLLLKALLSISPLLAIYPGEACAQAVKYCGKGDCFPVKSQIGVSEQPLLGVGIFEYMLFDVYTLALYGPANSLSTANILKDVPKRLVFKYHRNIAKEQMVEGAQKNLEANPKVDLQQLGKDLATLNSWYRNVKDGDSYELAYEPGVGTSLIYNGNPQGTIPGAQFAKAYFGIWLSDKPLSVPLRNSIFEGIKAPQSATDSK